MYHEFSSTNRGTWKYTYKGSDLLPFAKRQLLQWRDAEMAARKKMAEFMSNPKVNPSDREVGETKKDVETFAARREECEVYVHEFSRTPDREFHLSLGDVVFFGINQ